MSEDDQALYKKGLNTPEAENQNPNHTMTKSNSPPPPLPTLQEKPQKNQKLKTNKQNNDRQNTTLKTKD